MKNIFIAILLVSASTQLFGQNQSASFERNNEGFNIHASGDLEVNKTTTEEVAFVGSQSLLLEVTNIGTGNLQLLCKKFDVNVGDTYEVKFRIKANQERTINGKSQFTLVSEGSKTLIETPKLDIGEDWQLVEYTVEVPAELKGSIPTKLSVGFIETKITNAKGLKYYIDDFQITVSN
jgi:hypothetical protein